MMMVQLVYASRTNDELTRQDLTQILEASRKNNSASDVTGALMYNSRHFLQCLEGSRVNVNKTYLRILGDARHQEPALLHYREITTRDFANWGMAYVGEGIKNRELFLRYGAYRNFDPFSMSGESARQLLLTLSRNAD